jgi:uncharacterized protein YciI
VPQFAYRILPTRLAMLTEGPTEAEARVVAEHFAYLRRLCADGPVLLAGRTLAADANAFGIVVFEADSEPAARELMLADPAVRDGVMHAELYTFRVALWSPRGPRDATPPSPSASSHESSAP